MNKTLNILGLMVACTLFTTLGQIFFKRGSAGLSLDIVLLLTNLDLILGGIFYMIGAGLMILALRTGELSIVYPMVSLSFVWVSLYAALVLGESITSRKGIGLLMILGGIIFLGVSKRS